MPEFKKPHALTDVPFHYCPGCTHGIVHRLVAEVIDEMGIEGETIGVCPVDVSHFFFMSQVLSFCNVFFAFIIAIEFLFVNFF